MQCLCASPLKHKVEQGVMYTLVPRLSVQCFSQVVNKPNRLLTTCEKSWAGSLGTRLHTSYIHWT